MDSYVPHMITKGAAAVVERYPSVVTESATYGAIPSRKLRIDLTGFKSPYAQRKSFINLRPQAKNPVDDPAEAEPGIDLSGLDQIVEVGQARIIATILEHISKQTASKA